MILDSLVKDPGRLATLDNALSVLKSINFFGAMLDLATQRNKVLSPPEDLIKFSAQRAAWHDGYTQALEDMFYFRERYVNEAEGKSKPRPNFGAADKLYTTGEINKDEYRELTGVNPRDNSSSNIE